MANKKKKDEIPKPKKDIRIENGGGSFKENLVNFVRNTSRKPKK